MSIVHVSNQVIYVLDSMITWVSKHKIKHNWILWIFRYKFTSLFVYPMIGKF